MRYQAKAVLVTGAARGIGRATALALAREGAQLALWDLDAQGVQKTAVEINGAGGSAEAQRVDVSSAADVAGGVAELRSRFGRLDALVHCAGIMSAAFLDDCSDEEWERVLTVNLSGTFHVCKAAVPLLRLAVDGGRIVLVSSAAAKSATTIVGLAYVASKAGVIGMVRQLAYRLARDRITVNAVAPGFVDTDMPHSHFPVEVVRDSTARIPMRRMASAEEIAAAMLYLASDDAAYITGEVLDVNGGSLID